MRGMQDLISSTLYQFLAPCAIFTILVSPHTMLPHLRQQYKVLAHLKKDGWSLI
jgi:hypothetical protein